MDDQALSWVAQEGELAKALGTIISCPFKGLKLLREVWPWDNLCCFGLSVFDQIWELGPISSRINMGLIWL
jgi:hypothetical protein